MINRRQWMAGVCSLVVFGVQEKPKCSESVVCYTPKYFADAYVPKRDGSCPVITFSREPRSFPLKKYVKYKVSQ